jgi:hypothetical protein
VTDGDLIRDVVGSRNEPLSGEDMDHLPHAQTWVEFDRPVPFATVPEQTMNVQAVGLWSIPDTPLRMAYVLSDVPVELGDIPNLTQTNAERLVHGNAALFLLFWARRRLLGTMDAELSTHLGYDPHKHSFDFYGRFLTEASTSVKNVYDFLTSRSFDYTKAERPARDVSKFNRFKHLQGGKSICPRDYRMVHVNKEVVHGHGAPSEAIGTSCSVEIPGVFHRLVYCKTCGDLHRHDLIGHACRKCGLTVWPSANLRIERYWHSPHKRGSGPLKEIVRHMVS